MSLNLNPYRHDIINNTFIGPVMRKFTTLCKAITLILGFCVVKNNAIKKLFKMFKSIARTTKEQAIKNSDDIV